MSLKEDSCQRLSKTHILLFSVQHYIMNNQNLRFSFYGNINRLSKMFFNVLRGRWHGDVMIHLYHEINEGSMQFMKFLDDVRTLMKIRHENIVLFMGASIEIPQLAVITR